MTRRLLIDAGNTRVKWRTLDGATEVSRGAVRYDDDMDDWRSALPNFQADAVWVGSVAGERIDTLIAQWASKINAPAPEFVVVEREVLGLRVAYRTLSRLGVDRYLAMLGARADHDGALCIVDIGTAMTLDAVDARGMHKGGLIAPGPRTMMRSLLSGTANIGDVSDSPPTQPFARDTADAVTGGACYAAAALVDRFARAASSLLDAPVTLLLTGGGCGVVRPLLETTCEESPDLVFDGLLALAQRHERKTTARGADI